MSFFEVAAQVLPVLFLALVFEQQALRRTENDGLFDVTADLVVIAGFAIGESVCFYILVAQKGFSGAKEIVLLCLTTELSGLVAPQIRSRLADRRERRMALRLVVGLATVGGAIFLWFALRAASNPPGVLTAKEVLNHVVQLSAYGPQYFVSHNGRWHWIPDDYTFNCLVAKYPVIETDLKQMIALRGSADGLDARPWATCREP